MASILDLLSLTFGTTKMAAYANKLSVGLFIAKNMEMFTALILYTRSLINQLLSIYQNYRKRE